MCGIVGYVGHREPVSVLIDGLKKLEYRGYDSAGIAIATTEDIKRTRAAGRIKNLEDELERKSQHTSAGFAGIGHTRWSTHGVKSIKNAHPHMDTDGRVAVVHNGIIDNYSELKARLVSDGVVFSSDTDTEVIAHLIAKELDEGCGYIEAIENALRVLHGTYGLAIVFGGHPNIMFAARKGSPLVIGVGNDENFIASDPLALVKYTDRVIFMDDFEVASITSSNIEVKKLDGSVSKHEIHEIEDCSYPEDSSPYESFMLKEIYEQPQSISRCFAGRIRQDVGNCVLGGLNFSPRDMRSITSINIIGCGTSYHAGLVAAHAIEKFSRIRCSVEVASEFSARNPIIDSNGIYFVISQSGETYDTIESIKEIRAKGGNVFGIVNSVGSTIARMCDSGVYIHAGPEIAVASTKAFTSQLAALMMFSISIGRATDMSTNMARIMCRDLKKVPEAIDRFFFESAKNCELAAYEILQRQKYCLFLGRGASYPVALEGALKLKEISYIPSEAYPAGEMKHGPIAMIEEGTPVVFICPNDEYLEANMNSIEEVKTRGAFVISVGHQMQIPSVDLNIVTPKVNNVLSPFLNVIPLQLIAYHVATMMGQDVDKPRNLAKSVTVS